MLELGGALMQMGVASIMEAIVPVAIPIPPHHTPSLWITWFNPQVKPFPKKLTSTDYLTKRIDQMTGVFYNVAIFDFHVPCHRVYLRGN